MLVSTQLTLEAGEAKVTLVNATEGGDVISIGVELRAIATRNNNKNNNSSNNNNHNDNRNTTSNNKNQTVSLRLLSLIGWSGRANKFIYDLRHVSQLTWNASLNAYTVNDFIYLSAQSVLSHSISYVLSHIRSRYNCIQFWSFTFWRN